MADAKGISRGAERMKAKVIIMWRTKNRNHYVDSPAIAISNTISRAYIKLPFATQRNPSSSSSSMGRAFFLFLAACAAM